MLIFINNYYLRRRHIDAVVTYVLRSSAHAIGQQNNGKQILSGVFFFFFFPYTECIFLEEWKRVGVATLDDRTIYAPRCLYKEQQTEKTLLHVQ